MSAAEGGHRMKVTRMIANVAAGWALVSKGLTGVAGAQDRPSLLDVPFTSVFAPQAS